MVLRIADRGLSDEFCVGEVGTWVSDLARKRGVRTRAFGVVESLIAAHDELFPCAVRWVKLCDAEAGSNDGTDLSEVDLGLLDGSVELGSDHGGSFEGGVGKEDGELVASNACEQIMFAEAALKAVGDCDEGIVAAVVAVGVVDLFQAVQIKDDGRDKEARTAASKDVLFCGDFDGAAVEESSEWVGRGLNLEIFTEMGGRHPDIRDDCGTLKAGGH